MTDGNLVKTIPVEGVCSVVLYCLATWTWEVRNFRRSRVQLVARSHGARRGVGLRTRLGFPKLQGSVDSVDCKGSLRFSKVVGETSNEVASLDTNFVGTESFFHVKALD